jgi:hypothetical protein
MIGAQGLPADWKELAAEATKARAYYQLTPYPRHGFRDWAHYTNGPRPRCLPLWKSLPNKGAQWLFGAGVQFSGAACAEWANDMLDKTRMDSRLMSIAKDASWCGSVVLYWKLGPDGTVRVNKYLPYWHCVVYQGEDPTEIEMLRLQFPVQDAESGQNYMFREEWTTGEVAEYDRVPITEEQAKTARAGETPAGVTFGPPRVSPNPWGLIPAAILHNLPGEGGMGAGDLWGLWEAVDQVNFTANLCHLDNQTRVSPGTIYIDLQPADSAEPFASGPGSKEELESKDEKSGKVQLLEPTGAVRPHIEKFLDDIARMTAEAAGGVYLNPEAISGFGQLSGNVIRLILGPLIASVEEKRKSMGEDGLLLFMRRMAQGLSKLGHKQAPDDLDWDDLRLSWPPMVMPTAQELEQMARSLSAEVAGGFTSIMTAAEVMASARGRETQDELGRLNLAEPESTENEREQEAGRSRTSEIGRSPDDESGAA